MTFLTICFFALIYRGFIMRLWEYESVNGSFTQMKRGWVRFYCGLHGLFLYFPATIFFVFWLPFLVWGFWTALWLIRKSPNAVRKTKIYLAVLLVVNGISLILGSLSSLEVLSGALFLAFDCAWLAYFHRSRRVKDAYPEG